MTRSGVTIALLILVLWAAGAVASSEQRFESASVIACPPAVTQTDEGGRFALGAIRPVGLAIQRAPAPTPGLLTARVGWWA